MMGSEVVVVVYDLRGVFGEVHEACVLCFGVHVATVE